LDTSPKCLKISNLRWATKFNVGMLIPGVKQISGTRSGPELTAWTEIDVLSAAVCGS